MRKIWSRYYGDCDGIIYIIDALDRIRWKESAQSIAIACGADRAREIPILVIANKRTLLPDEDDLVVSLKEILNPVMGEISAQEYRIFVGSTLDRYIGKPSLSGFA